MRRMEVVAETAAEMREFARFRWMEENGTVYREVEANIDIPSSSSRPPTTLYPYYPRHYTLSPVRASTSRDPRRTLSPRPPVGPMRIGSPVWEVTRTEVVRERSRSPSPYYTPGMYSPRGYLSVMTDSDDDHTTVSAGSGYMMRVPVVRDEGVNAEGGSTTGATGEDTTSLPEVSTEGEGEGTFETVVVISSDKGQNEGVVLSSQEPVSSDIEVWVPESPIH